jgi:hypothetical protein
MRAYLRIAQSGASFGPTHRAFSVAGFISLASGKFEIRKLFKFRKMFKFRYVLILKMGELKNSSKFKKVLKMFKTENFKFKTVQI